MRLQKFLADSGVASRRRAEALIEAGRVTINGKVAQLGDVIDPAVDEVMLDGRPVRPSNKVYILLNKPRGVVSSVKDTHHRRTVLDCISGVKERVFPVGRLDLDAEGALILTNDGGLAYRLTHPKFQVDKTYLAWVEGVMTRQTARKLAKGVWIEDGRTAPANVTIVESRKDATLIRLVLREGRKREVKRMCSEVGHPVLTLTRVSVGNVDAEGLEPGEWRYLDEKEIANLQQLTGLST